MEPYRTSRGTAPLVVSMPHVGTHVPADLRERFAPAARGLPDTDWHVDRLYDFLSDLGVSTIAATHSRYVADLNRPPDGAPLYPGASETELCPTTTFAGEPVYLPGRAPDLSEVNERRDAIWQPYHAWLADELAAVRARHGLAVLWDAHSIRSRVPRFFAGRLPDLNFGTDGGATAARELIAGVAAVAREAVDYSHVVDGRFKGGYITRAYGKPDRGIHAVQLELSQATYMDEEPPFQFRDDLARKLRPHLRRLLETAIGWARDRASENQRREWLHDET